MNWMGWELAEAGGNGRRRWDGRELTLMLEAVRWLNTCFGLPPSQFGAWLLILDHCFYEMS
jgi:hypothetical protein